MVDIADNEMTNDIYMQEAKIISILGRQKWIPARKARFYQILLGMVLVPKMILTFCGGLFIQHSPPIILMVSVSRLLEQDYGISGEDMVNRAKLKAALNIFYALVAFQSLVAIYWFALLMKLDVLSAKQVSSLTIEQGGAEKWGKVLVRMYYLETTSKLKKDGKLPDNWNLITYGVGLLQSPSGDDHLWGARVLDKLYDKDTSVRQELLSSRISIQNLIGMIGWRGTDDNIENIERAARIVAHVASDLHITHFSGTLQSIYFLLRSFTLSCEQITCRSGNPDEQRLPDKQDQHGSLKTSKNQDDAHMVVPIKDQTSDEHEQLPNSPSAWFAKKKGTGFRDRINKLREAMGICSPKYRHPYESRGTKELISQGLMILEGLTQDEVNCREISKDQSLLSRITGPLRTHDFLSKLWDNTMLEMLSRSLTVLSRLLRIPGDGCSRLCQELASNMEVVSNLMAIMKTNSEGAQQLHGQAVEILTKLAFDGSLKKPDFNNFFKVLLCIFLEKEANNTTVQEPNNAPVQESNNSQVEQADRERATRLRGKAGEALARLLPVRAARGILTEQDAINLSTMVLYQILSTEMAATQGNRENQSKQTKFIAAMLSLIVVMCNENESSKEYFARRTPEDTDLVKKLKDILEANKCRSPECWNIVKLTCQVAIAMIKVKPSCIQYFNEYNFTETLTGALETMSEIDDCMIFARNDREVIKPARTLASLVKEVQKLLNTATSQGQGN